MKKIIAILSVFILLMSSCSDNENTIIVNNQPVLVKKIITKNLSSNTILNVSDVEYNGNKILKTSNQNSIVNYIYTGDLITNIKIYDLNNTLMVEYLYSYENNNLVETIRRNFFENICEKRLYVYNTNGTVDFTYYTGDLAAQTTLYKTGAITIQNYEVVSIIGQNHLDSFNWTKIKTYDNHNNPEKNVVGMNKLNVELDRVGGVYENLLSDTFIYNNSQYTITDFSYEYDSNGFPILSNYNFNDVNYQIEYFY
jgi:hypothetical protein